jgi:single-stranded-DNA-specific exonuclease
MASSEPARAFQADPYDYGEVRRLAAELSLAEPVAITLVRRGYRTVDAARRFLEAREEHDPLEFDGMEEVCERILAVVGRGGRITVHGDYDVDGVSSTAILVSTLRSLGADCDWLIPDRLADGYGLTMGSVEKLRRRGTELAITVDCGIGSVEEVAAAQAAGIDMVVTDHHLPGERLPDCPIVATRPSDYPFPELCGTGVVLKLAHALLGEDALRRHLDLVALATVADVVPLVGENRTLAIAGLRALARTRRPGLRALMRTAGVDPAAVDAAAIGFRLAPRINAAGRLGHPATALELLLTEDERRAGALADELERLNRERQAVEDRIVREAVAQVEEWPEPARRRRGYVLANADWHEGVIGIVASRLVERYHRPVVLIAGAEEAWKGSGRSIGAFDLHAGLAACADHLARFGGHRAAAGLSIRPDGVAAFARAFAEHADAALPEEALRPVTHVDAVLPRGRNLTLDLCAELGRLAPFGLGNPPVTLLAPGSQLVDLETVGEGKHLRFRVRQETGRDGGSAIGFRLGPQLERLQRLGRCDVAFRLEENRWNGTVAPQLVVQRIYETPERYAELVARFERAWRNPPPELASVLEELGVGDGAAKRHLLESERFRALLAQEPALASAA